MSEPLERRLRIEIAPKTIALVFAIVAGLWLVAQLAAVIEVIVVALVLVGTFDPIVAWLEKRGLRRGRALVLVFVVAGLAVAGLVLLMVPPLVAQLVDLISNAPKVRDDVIKSLQGRHGAEPIIKSLQELPVQDLGARAATILVGYSTKLLLLIGYAISTLFLAMYFLADPTRSKGLIYSVVPRPHHVKTAKILIELRAIVGGYMRGQLITSLAISVFVFVLLTILRVENALAIALFAGLTDIIPFVGGYIASTPVVLAATQRGTTATIIVIVLMIVYQEFESRILVPSVYGRVLRLPPAIVLIALLVGGTLGGIVGALLALPIAAGLQMLARELRVDLPGETPASDATLHTDEKASKVYEQLTEDLPAKDAGVIADDLATIVKKAEADDASVSDRLPIAPPDPKPA
ncbi:MAG TPA: AI-2E family transporter [Kofleriaceae bacterium]|nr:AI-2E family transporter [Kofleriaceae bacterium]